MKNHICILAALASLAALGTQPATAGPAFAYSWLTTDKTFEQCMTVANDMVTGLGYPHVEKSRFGVTGENNTETLYINCEDLRHVSLVLMRPERPKVGEIDMIVSVMQNRLDFVQ